MCVHVGGDDNRPEQCTALTRQNRGQDPRSHHPWMNIPSIEVSKAQELLQVFFSQKNVFSSGPEEYRVHLLPS